MKLTIASMDLEDDQAIQLAPSVGRTCASVSVMAKHGRIKSTADRVHRFSTTR